ncbi:MAG TPA: STAS domain-containing protein [Candidatus Rifleibacterium sp.]|nr:STAS domain-containing protein [Candidatus Rifleibacterium sp.]
MINNLLEIVVDAEKPGQIIVKLKGEVDQLSVRNLKKVLDEHQAHDAAELIFDLDEVEFMASAGLAIFASYQDLFNKSKSNQKLRVINCSPGVYRIFHLTMLTEMLEVSEKP